MKIESAQDDVDTINVLFFVNLYSQIKFTNIQ